MGSDLHGVFVVARPSRQYLEVQARHHRRVGGAPSGVAGSEGRATAAVETQASPAAAAASEAATATAGHPLRQRAARWL